jgi:hypothetical protein
MSNRPETATGTSTGARGHGGSVSSFGTTARPPLASRIPRSNAELRRPSAVSVQALCRRLFARRLRANCLAGLGEVVGRVARRRRRAGSGPAAGAGAGAPGGSSGAGTLSSGRSSVSGCSLALAWRLTRRRPLVMREVIHRPAPVSTTTPQQTLPSRRVAPISRVGSARRHAAGRLKGRHRTQNAGPAPRKKMSAGWPVRSSSTRPRRAARVRLRAPRGGALQALARDDRQA